MSCLWLSEKSTANELCLLSLSLPQQKMDMGATGSLIEGWKEDTLGDLGMVLA